MTTNTIQIATAYLKTASSPCEGFTVLSIKVKELGDSVVYHDAFGDEQDLKVGTFLTPRMLRRLEADLASFTDFSGVEVAIAIVR